MVLNLGKWTRVGRQDQNQDGDHTGDADHDHQRVAEPQRDAAHIGGGDGEDFAQAAPYAQRFRSASTIDMRDKLEAGSATPMNASSAAQAKPLIATAGGAGCRSSPTSYRQLTRDRTEVNAGLTSD